MTARGELNSLPNEVARVGPAALLQIPDVVFVQPASYCGVIPILLVKFGRPPSSNGSTTMKRLLYGDYLRFVAGIMVDNAAQCKAVQLEGRSQFMHFTVLILISIATCGVHGVTTP